jgi:rhodanese-related sulfurtransferase
LNPMNRLKSAVLQAMALLVIGLIVSFAHNSFSVNGINPFREIGEVPVVTDPGTNETEGIRIVDLDGLDEAVAAGAILIDARTKAEYDEGHIPGAILIDYYELGRYLNDLLPTLDPARRTVVYCYGPDFEDAELLARELYMLGFTDLHVYKGGFEDWTNSGRETEGGTDQ